MKKQKRRKIANSREDKILNAIVLTCVSLILLAVLYPLIFIVSSSFSSGEAVTGGKVILWPVDFSLVGYKIVASYRKVWLGYRNTIFYTVAGTLINLVLTILAAYPLSRKNFVLKPIITKIYMFTMFFGGGLIPYYILLKDLHLLNTVWAILLTGALSLYNMIIMRTFFVNSIPNELYEAATIDGIDDIGYLWRIVLPLSKPVLAVITLYYAVGHWNAYWNAMLYLRNSDLHPLQMVLREVLNVAKNITLDEDMMDAEMIKMMTGAADVMKYALIVVATAPVLIAYPFVKKFFKKGVMIGSVKG